MKRQILNAYGVLRNGCWANDLGYSEIIGYGTACDELRNLKAKFPDHQWCLHKTSKYRKVKGIWEIIEN